MNETDEERVNPVEDDNLTTDEVIETGEEAIAKYADGLETTEEAVAALDAVDRELENLQHRKRNEAARQLTNDVRPAERNVARADDSAN